MSELVSILSLTERQQLRQHDYHHPYRISIFHHLEDFEYSGLATIHAVIPNFRLLSTAQHLLKKVENTKHRQQLRTRNCRPLFPRPTSPSYLIFSTFYLAISLPTAALYNLSSIIIQIYVFAHYGNRYVVAVTNSILLISAFPGALVPNALKLTLQFLSYPIRNYLRNVNSSVCKLIFAIFFSVSFSSLFRLDETDLERSGTSKQGKLFLLGFHLITNRQTYSLFTSNFNHPLTSPISSPP